MTVRIERHGEYVAELVMDRPQAMNAISTEQAERIAEACADLTADPTVRAVVLSSAVAKAFCVGADLKERNSFTDEDLAAQRPITQRAYGGVLNLPMPSIAAVEGYAMGGGCELALSCDLIVASDSAVFALPETGVGLVPGGGGTQLLARRVGPARAADMIFTGRRVLPEEAERMGLVDRWVSGGEALDQAVALATDIAGRSPLGNRNAKRALRLGADLPMAEGLVLEEEAWRATAFSDHRREGIAAFNEKRPPRWPDLPRP